MGWFSRKDYDKSIEEIRSDTYEDRVKLLDHEFAIQSLQRSTSSLRDELAREAQRSFAFEKLVEWQQRSTDCFLASMDGDYVTPITYNIHIRNADIRSHEDAMGFWYDLAWQRDGYAIYTNKVDSLDGE